MDDETKEMLAKIIEGQSKMSDDINVLKEDVKISFIKLESIEKDIKIIAEVHTAHKDQNITSFENTNLIIKEKTELIETAVTSVSRDVKDIKQSLDVLIPLSGKHEVEIKILQSKTA